MLEDVVTSVVGSYVFDSLKRFAPKPLTTLFPAAFHANPRILGSIELQLQAAKKNILAKYPDVETLKIFLDEKSLEKAKVLDPIFDYLFLGKSLDEERVIRSIAACVSEGEAIQSGKIVKTDYWRKGAPSENAKFRSENATPVHGLSIREVVREIVTEIENSVIQRGNLHKEAVIQIALSEIRNVVRTLEINGETLFSKIQEIDTSSENNLYRALKAYYEHIRKNSGRLVVHGLNEAISDNQSVSHSIESAFVPLTMSPLGNRLGARDDRATKEGAWRGNAMRILRECPLVVLRGHAGCGKTTLMQWYILNSGPSSDSSYETTIPVTPIYIPLRRLEAHKDYNWSVEDLMRFAVPSETIREEFKFDWIEKSQSIGCNLSFLLDGVDELSESRRAKLWQLVRDIRNSAPKARIVITSRHLSAVHLSSGAYRDDEELVSQKNKDVQQQWDIPVGFLEFVMSPLTDNEVFSFIKKWHEAIDKNYLSHEASQQLPVYSEELIFRLMAEDSLEAIELCRTPMLCGLVCLVNYIQGGKLPDSRRQLYEVATKILVKVRDEHRKVYDDGPFAKFNLQHRLSLLRHIALTMQEGTGLASDGQSIEVDKPVVVDWVKGWMDNSPEPSMNAEYLLGKMLDRSSVIREPTYNKIDFVHRSFMEFLAANEIVLKKEPYSIRQYIQYDQWWSTLQFCMDTETGGHYFAGDLLENLINYAIHDKSGNRDLLVRIARLVASANQLPQTKFAILGTAVEHIMPPRSWEEVEALTHFPYECVESLLEYQAVKGTGNSDALEKCAALLARHSDRRAGKALLSGYQNDGNHSVIQWVNYSLKVPLAKQYALIARIRNKSYNNTVCVRLSDFNSTELSILPIRKFSIFCDDLPNVALSFDPLSETSSLTIDGISEEHWTVIVNRLHSRQTRRLTFLEIRNSDIVDCAVLADKFPTLRELRIHKCKNVVLDGLSTFEFLHSVYFKYSRQQSTVAIQHVPKSLRDLYLTRDINVEEELLERPGLSIRVV